MLVLGIESSCDETAAAVVESSGGRPRIRSNVVASQIDIHRHFGGVVPELASRNHLKMIIPVIEESLAQAGVGLAELSGIAVTQGPGLIGSLLVGFNVAKSLSLATGIPYRAVSHLESHLFAAMLESEFEFPFLGLVVSGGHSSILWLEKLGQYTTLARTRDDAVGEAFDKIAKFLRLGYPGGPAIEKTARSGNPRAFSLPRAVMKDRSLDFSYSGLKTAVILETRKHSLPLPPSQLSDLAASFQEAAVDMIISRVESALRLKGTNQLVASGGVACNTRLRERLTELSRNLGFRLLLPSPHLCTDNGAMVAMSGLLYFQAGMTSSFDLNAYPIEAFHQPGKNIVPPSGTDRGISK